MWRIRPEQVESFHQRALQNFEDEMVDHLNDFAPKVCEVRGEKSMRKAIRLGIDHAKKYDFTNRGPVRFYIELMITLGSYFDTDPQYPWASEILSDRKLGDQAARSDRLFEKYEQFMDYAMGPSFEHAIEALQRLQSLDLAYSELGELNLENRVLGVLHKAFPEKCTYVGQQNLKTLLSHALQVASSHHITSDYGKLTILGLMFGVGHGVTRDLLYPWVAITLSDSNVKNPNARVERLSRQVKIYFDGILLSLKAEQENVQAV